MEKHQVLRLESHSLEVGLMALARSSSMRLRGVRLHWDNAFLPLNVVLLGSASSRKRAERVEIKSS